MLFAIDIRNAFDMQQIHLSENSVKICHIKLITGNVKIEIEDSNFKKRNVKETRHRIIVINAKRLCVVNVMEKQKKLYTHSVVSKLTKIKVSRLLI